MGQGGAQDGRLVLDRGQRRAVRVPGRLGRFAGPQGRATARSQRVSNRRFREATGWSPRWRSVAEGFATLIN